MPISLAHSLAHSLSASRPPSLTHHHRPLRPYLHCSTHPSSPQDPSMGAAESAAACTEHPDPPPWAWGWPDAPPRAWGRLDPPRLLDDDVGSLICLWHGGSRVAARWWRRLPQWVVAPLLTRRSMADFTHEEQRQQRRLPLCVPLYVFSSMCSWFLSLICGCLFCSWMLVMWLCS